MISQPIALLVFDKVMVSPSSKDSESVRTDSDNGGCFYPDKTSPFSTTHDCL